MRASLATNWECALEDSGSKTICDPAQIDSCAERRKEVISFQKKI